MKAEIFSKHRGKLKADVLLLLDNLPIYRDQFSVAKVANYNFELQPHPFYSPNLAPYDFFLFPKLKSRLCGHNFGINDEVICTMEDS